MNATTPVDLDTSVAGEEDPGAGNEIGSAVKRPTAAPSDAPAGTDEKPAGRSADDREKRGRESGLVR